MEKELKPITILMADDDDDDRLMTKDAMREAKLFNDLRFVENGEELMAYLLREGDYADPKNSPRPGIIILDLNMPKKDGREVLMEIRSNADLQIIPVVILTTSTSEKDINLSYKLGANNFITKPVTFEGLVETVKALDHFYFGINTLPKVSERYEGIE